MNHEKESNGGRNQGNIGEFERLRSKVFESQFGITYEDAQQIASWANGELQAYWKGAIEYFDKLIKEGGDIHE